MSVTDVNSWVRLPGVTAAPSRGILPHNLRVRSHGAKGQSGRHVTFFVPGLRCSEIPGSVPVEHPSQSADRPALSVR